MYAELLLENFQSHVRTKVRLAGAGQLTVVLGPSDSGKTAIMRALRWLQFNEAPGDFIRVGADFARVSLRLEDGATIGRERGKSFNRYFTIKDGQRQVYEGFGSGVPQEVRELLGVWPVSFGQDVEICPTLSEQLDAPFLGKSISAPAKARVLGKLAGTEEVDLAMRGAAADALKASQAAGQADDEVRRLEAQMADYGYLDGLAQAVAQAEGFLARADTATAKRDRLKALRDTLAGISRGIDAAQQTLTRLQHLPAAEVLLATAGEKAVKHNELIRLRARLGSILTFAAEASGGLAKHQGAERAAAAVAQAEGLFSRQAAMTKHRQTLEGLTQLEGIARQTLIRTAGAEQAAAILAKVPDLMQRRIVLGDDRGSLNGLAQEAARTTASIALLEKAAADASAQYLSELTAAGRCPVCGSEIDPEHVKEVA